MGIRATAQSDKPGINAAMVPMPAPERSNPAAMGKLTWGLPGVNLPAAAPIRIPHHPDSVPIQRASISLGKMTCTIPAIMKANLIKRENLLI